MSYESRLDAIEAALLPPHTLAPALLLIVGNDKAEDAENERAARAEFRKAHGDITPGITIRVVAVQAPENKRQ